MPGTRNTQAGKASAEAPGRVRRRYHVHRALAGYAMVTLLIAIGAFNSQNNLLYWLFGLSLSLIVVSGLLSGAMMMGLRVRRLALPDVTAGGALRIRYVISNKNRLIPAFALTLTEIIEAPSGGVRRSRRAPAAPAPQPGAPRAELDDLPGGFCPHVPPRGESVVEVAALAKSRGVLRTRGVRVSTSFPFGIVLKSIEVELPGGCIVRPEPLEPAAATLRDAMGLTPGGESRRSPAGPGDEFRALNEYTPGDDPRQIAWRPSARSSTLLVRQQSAPAPRRTWVVLALQDADVPQERERAISLAAGVIDFADRQGRSVGLVIPALGVMIAARAGGWHIASLLNDLALIPRGALPPGGGGTPALSRAEARAAVIIHPGGGREPAGELGLHLWAGPAGGGA